MAIPYFFHFETIKALHRLTKAFDSLQGENWCKTWHLH
jgi:hypothetical protein